MHSRESLGSCLDRRIKHVYPLSKAMAEALGKMNPDVQFKIGFSGTGGGFQKLCAGRVDIAGASRPINSIEDEEGTAQHIELPVAFDTLTSVVNAKNTFANCLSINELSRMREPAAERTVVTWRDIRPSFPADPLVLFSPGKALAVVGTEGKSRGDVTMSQDDCVIQRGVADNPSAIGYLGYSCYQGSREKLKLVSVDNGHGCIAPSTKRSSMRRMNRFHDHCSSMSMRPLPSARISKHLRASTFPRKRAVRRKSRVRALASCRTRRPDRSIRKGARARSSAAAQSLE